MCSLTIILAKRPSALRFTETASQQLINHAKQSSFAMECNHTSNIKPSK